MKKVLFGAALMMSFISFSFAQAPATKTNKQTSHKTIAAAKKVTQSPGAAQATIAATNTAKHVAKRSMRLKKDGSPDKRFKSDKKG